jgi:hypothetical protein
MESMGGVETRVDRTPCGGVADGYLGVDSDTLEGRSFLALSSSAMSSWSRTSRSWCIRLHSFRLAFLSQLGKSLNADNSPASLHLQDGLYMLKVSSATALSATTIADRLSVLPD